MSNTFLRALDHGGEPSDAEVDAAAIAYAYFPDSDEAPWDAMRAALKAAYALRNKEALRRFEALLDEAQFLLEHYGGDPGFFGFVDADKSRAIIEEPWLTESEDLHPSAPWPLLTDTVKGNPE